MKRELDSWKSVEEVERYIRLELVNSGLNNENGCKKY